MSKEQAANPQVLSANRLNDGRVIYLTAEGQWRPEINDARVAETEASATAFTEAGRMAVQKGELVDPYLIDVAINDGQITPRKYREYLRAVGPSQDTAQNL